MIMPSDLRCGGVADVADTWEGEGDHPGPGRVGSATYPLPLPLPATSIMPVTCAVAAVADPEEGGLRTPTGRVSLSG